VKSILLAAKAVLPSICYVNPGGEKSTRDSRNSAEVLLFTPKNIVMLNMVKLVVR
jgi:hypothetical protein